MVGFGIELVALVFYGLLQTSSYPCRSAIACQHGKERMACRREIIKKSSQHSNHWVILAQVIWNKVATNGVCGGKGTYPHKKLDLILADTSNVRKSISAIFTLGKFRIRTAEARRPGWCRPESSLREKPEEQKESKQVRALKVRG